MRDAVIHIRLPLRKVHTSEKFSLFNFPRKAWGPGSPDFCLEHLMDRLCDKEEELSANRREIFGGFAVSHVSLLSGPCLCARIPGDGSPNIS
jgi:hypothetical protein